MPERSRSFSTVVLWVSPGKTASWRGVYRSIGRTSSTASSLARFDVVRTIRSMVRDPKAGLTKKRPHTENSEACPELAD